MQQSALSRTGVDRVLEFAFDSRARGRAVERALVA